MRVAAEDPGGMASEYQGLAVNRIAEEREEELVDRVVLAPAPAALNESEDLPASECFSLRPGEENTYRVLRHSSFRMLHWDTIEQAPDTEQKGGPGACPANLSVLFLFGSNL